MNQPQTQQIQKAPIDERTRALAKRMDTIKALAERAKPQLAQALPRHLGVDRMLKVFYSALSRPDAKGETPLLECSPLSLLMSLMRAAELGLEPNTGIGLSYLVPYRNSRTRQRECQLIPGYRGLVQLARQSGAVRSIEARVVYERDAFKLAYGFDQILEHAPHVDGDPGKLRLVYAVAHLVEGDPVVEVMSRSQIDAIRARSKASDSGPWVTDYEEMARKTVIRRICKFLPASTDPGYERARGALEAAVEIDTAAAAGLRTLAIPSGADTLALLNEAGETPGLIVDEEADEAEAAAETKPAEAAAQPPPAAPPPPPVQAPPAAAPAGQQTLGAVDPPKEEAPAKAPRKSLDEQRAENRATVDQTIVTIREYEDLRELETWAAGWKASKTRTALPSALRQEVDKALEEHRARLREAGAQEEPGASG